MTWVNFKDLRERLRFAEVLRHYGVELKLKGSARHQGFCPLPTHQGQKKSASFSADLERGIWQCFGCGAKGNTLDFAVRMEGLNPASGKDVRMVALKLQEQLEGNSSGCARQHQDVRPPPTRPQNPGQAPQSPKGKATTGPIIVNAPLDFELKGLDPTHPYLLERGFTRETIEFFGLGHCSRGTFQGRVCIPLHDSQGRLIGYAGRIVDDSQISEQNPKYKLPPSRLRNDEVHEFHKSLFLYNGFRIKSPVDDLAVVEGFPSTWWLWQNGYPNVVAVMGASCSPEQANLIVRLVQPDGRVWIMPDGNEAGERCAASVLTQVSPHRFCRWVKLDVNHQPTDYDGNKLSLLFNIQEER